MTPRRDPTGRLPQGAGLVIGLILAGAIWAGVGSLIVVTALRPAPVIYQGETHADR